MTIEALKDSLTKGTFHEDLVILKTNGSDFLAHQYVNAIVKHLNKPPIFIESLDELLHDDFSFFYDEPEDINIRVWKIDKLEATPEQLLGLKSLIIVTNKFADKEVEKQLSSLIISLPKLEEWQITDWVYSLSEGADKSDLDWLLQILHNNLYRLEQELDKISLFTENERKYLLKEMRRDGTFDDLSTYNIFNFSNAITHKDVGAIKSVYKEINRIDISDFGLLALLLKGFRNILMVQLVGRLFEYIKVNCKFVLQLQQHYSIKNFIKP